MDEEERQKEITRLTELLERPKKANIAMRSIYRWILEFLRNCMVVAALFYLAQKSGDWWLYAIAGAAGFALAGLCYTYIENAWPAVDITGKGWLRKHATILGSVLLLQFILAGITIGLVITVDKIVKIQGQTTKGP